MATGRRELALTSEEDLLAAQQRFAAGNEAPSAQLRAKRSEKAGQSKKVSEKKVQKVSWAPELEEEVDAESGGGKRSDHFADSGRTSSRIGNPKSKQVVGPISGGSSLPEQGHPRIGPGTDLAAKDDDDSSDDDSADESGGGQKGHNFPPYQPLLTVGVIKEKGFSGDNATAVTLPSARVTPFPEARHRSDGPHWGPVTKEGVEQPVSERDVVPPFDPSTAIPLSRTPSKKKAGISKFRQALMESRKQGETENKLASSKANKEKYQGAGRPSRSEEGSLGDTEVATESYAQQAVKRRGKVEKGESVKPSAQSGESEAIDAENCARLAAMSADEVAAEQTSLQEMLPAGVLEALRERGAKKLAGGSPSSSRISKHKGDESQSNTGEGMKAPLRRQPTPMPGAIRAMKGVQDSLGAITEDESLEDVPEPSLRLEKQKETPLQEGALRRQPTPLPGAIPKVNKTGGPSLSPLVEEEQKDEYALQEEEGLDRAEGPLEPAAKYAESVESHGKQGSDDSQSTESRGMQNSGLSLAEVAPVIGTAVMSSSLKLHDQALRKDGKMDNPSGTGILRRQPTPMPSEIVSIGAERETVLETLEEEDEEPETGAQQKREGALKRQGTPLPSAIPAPKRGLETPLETLQEEEGLDDSPTESQEKQPETSTQQKRGGALMRQGTPLPTAIPAPKLALKSSLETLQEEEGLDDSLTETQEEEPGTSAHKKGGRSLMRQGTPLPSAIPAPKRGLETPLETLQEDEGLDESLTESQEEEPETSAQQRRGGALKRQGTPLPSAIPAPKTGLGSALETLQEDEILDDSPTEVQETSAHQERGRSLKRQGTPLPSAIPAPKRGLETLLETMQEEESNDSPTETQAKPKRVSQFEKVNASDLRFDLDGAPLAPADISSTSDERKVAERDILRSEGDPSASGYSLKEATALARSTIPGQRTVALRLISAVLRRALAGIHGLEPGGKQEEGRKEELGGQEKLWARVWAYALSSDVQLAVLLRSALDDSHASVLAAAAQALVSLLACNENESLLEVEEALWRSLQEPLSNHTRSCTRSAGVLTNGVSNWGRWRAKATVSTSDDASQDDSEETVGDNAQLAGADVAAGLIRMGILPRIRYILEVLGLPALDEPLLNILIALSRHSDAAAAANRTCPRLLPTLQSISIGLPTNEVRPQAPSQAAQAKAVKLLRVLSQADCAFAAQLRDQGLLQLAMRHLFTQPRTVKAPLYPPAFVEALRLWRICALYGLGSNSFADYYPALCFLLEPPTGAGKGTETTPPCRETAEAYLLLEAIARTLPSMTNNEGESGSEKEKSVLLEWATVGPLVESACQWLNPGSLRNLLESSSSLDALSAVLHFLATVAERNQGQLGRLERSLVESLTAEHSLLSAGEDASPEANVKADAVGTKERQSLFQLLTEVAVGRSDKEALAGVTCLQGLLRLSSALVVRERLGGASKRDSSEEQTAGVSSEQTPPQEPKSQASSSSIEKRVISSFGGLAERLTQLMTYAGASHVQESAAAGLGLGWGFAAQRVWGQNLEVWRARAVLLAQLFEVLAVPVSTSKEKEGTQGGVNVGQLACLQRLGASLSAVRLIGPGNFKPVLSLLASSILSAEVLEVLLNGAAALLEEKVQDKLPSAQEMRRVLLPHFAGKWLRWTSEEEEETNDEENGWDVELEVKKILDADSKAHEERNGDKGRVRMSLLSKRVEGAQESPAKLSSPVAGQKLPLPCDWLLSPTAVAAQLSASIHIGASKSDTSEITRGVKSLVLSGLALMLGLEACVCSEVWSKQPEKKTAILKPLSLARKLHALNEVFLAAGELFLDEEIAPLLSKLQELYGQQLGSKTAHERASPETQSLNTLKGDDGLQQEGDLDFSAATDGPYESFAESLAEQFAATSFGDPIFGRQLALLLRRDVAPGALRLVVWRALADAKALPLLPKIAECLGEASAYLSPLEDDREALDLYATALASGQLDRTVQEGEQAMSVAALIAIHHLTEMLDNSTRSREETLASEKESREGSESRGSAMDRNGVLRLLRSLLLGVAQGRCQEAMLAAVLNHGLDTTISEASQKRRRRRTEACLEAAGGDRSLLQVVESLGR